MGQIDIFGNESPDAAEAQVELPGELSGRKPGWHLISTKRGPTGLWHTVKAAEGRYGEVRTACGIVGRKVTESQRQILLCRDCLDAAR